MPRMTRLLLAIAILVTSGCAGRYVGPGSGTRDERLQQRQETKSTSTDPVDPRVASPQQQKEIDNSGIPAGK